MSESERRVTRASVSRQGRSFEEKSNTNSQTEAAKMSFKDFVRSSLINLGTKIDKILTGQAALDEKFSNLEIQENTNASNIQHVIESIDFESANVKDHASQIQELIQNLNSAMRKLHGLILLLPVWSPRSTHSRGTPEGSTFASWVWGMHYARQWIIEWILRPQRASYRESPPSWHCAGWKATPGNRSLPRSLPQSRHQAWRHHCVARKATRYPISGGGWPDGEGSRTEASLKAAYWKII